MSNKKYFNQKTILASLMSAVIFISLTFILLPEISQAAVGTDGRLVPCGTTFNTDPCTLCDLIIGFQGIVKYGYNIAIYITLACLTFAGIMYLVSSGNESLVTSAKNFIKASLIGFILVFCAWLIVNTVLLLLSAKTDFGIESKKGSKWYQFNYTCNSGGGGTPPVQCADCQASCVGKKEDPSQTCPSSLKCCVPDNGGGGSTPGKTCGDNGGACGIAPCPGDPHEAYNDCGGTAYCCSP